MTQSVLDPDATSEAPGAVLVRRATTARTSRRRFVKGTTVVAGGLMAAGYVKPSLRELGVPGAQAQAISGPPPTPEPTPASCTIGYWKNGGAPLWDTANDPEWTGYTDPVPATTPNPIYQGTLFKAVFHTTGPGLAGLTAEQATWLQTATMMDVISGGWSGGAVELNAARQLVGAYLNAAFFGAAFSSTKTMAMLVNWWNGLVDGSPVAPYTTFADFETALDNANKGGDANCIPAVKTMRTLNTVTMSGSAVVAATPDAWATQPPVVVQTVA